MWINKQNLLKKISRSLLEPVKVEQDKIYPMFTFLNDKGDIDWEFLN